MLRVVHVTLVFFLSLPCIAFGEPRFVDPVADAASIVALTDQRLALMSHVAASKWQLGRPIVDEERESRVIEEMVAEGHALGLHEAVSPRFLPIANRTGAIRSAAPL